MKKIVAITYIAFFILLSACKKEIRFVTPAIAFSIHDVISNNYQYAFFREAIRRTGYDSLIAGKGPLTALVPDNNAFRHLGITQIRQIDAMPISELRNIVGYHLIRQTIYYQSVPQTVGLPYTAINGSKLYFSKAIIGALPGNPVPNLHINGSTDILPDILCNNGVIQVIDSALYAPVQTIQQFLISDTSFTILIAGLKKFNYWDTLASAGPISLLAPTNTAFRLSQVTLDSINSYQSNKYKRALFEAYIIPHTQFYLTDINDYAISNGGGDGKNYLYRKGYYLATSYPPYGNGGFVVADSVGNVLGPGGLVTSTNLTMTNGVVQAVNGLFVLPQNVKINP